MKNVFISILLSACIAAPVANAGEATPPVAGVVIADTVSSTTLGEDRAIVVALPDGYEASDERYPVLYLTDAGWHFLTAVAATRFLAETSYVSAHRIPPVIVVGIVNHDRNHDDTPTPCVSQHGMSFPTSGGADAFLAFMRDELIPHIDATYRTHPYRVLCGWSLGGLLTMHALVTHPDIFGGHLAISPSLWWDERVVVERAAELAADGGVRERDLVMTIGTGEEGGLCYNAVHDLVERWKEAPLDGLAFTFLEVPDEDHNHGPYKAYFDGLRALFADWFYPEDAFAAGTDSLEHHYAALSKRRGYAIDIPDHIYNALALTYLSEDRPDDAVAAIESQCARRPLSPMVHFQLGEVCRKAHYNEKARDAYRRALELERAAAAPDSVFINYVETIIAGLDGGS